ARAHSSRPPCDDDVCGDACDNARSSLLSALWLRSQATLPAPPSQARPPEPPWTEPVPRATPRGSARMPASPTHSRTTPQSKSIQYASYPSSSQLLLGSSTIRSRIVFSPTLMLTTCHPG